MNQCMTPASSQSTSGRPQRFRIAMLIGVSAMLTIAFVGCDMGTYNKRLKEQRFSSPDDAESNDEENENDSP